MGMGVEEEALETVEEKERRENIRLVDEEEDNAFLNWELVFNLITAALAVILVLWSGGFKGF